MVTWPGTPIVPERAIGTVPDGEGYKSITVWNPFVPKVDAATKGIEGVLVFLEGIAPEQSRPWDHPAVQLDVRDFQYTLRQQGIVRRGDAVKITTNDPELHIVRARGVSFFSLTFAKPGERTRTFEQPGFVELTSGSGYFWNTVDLLVRDDPYATTTDKTGVFNLAQVPAGEYDLVVRLRNPRVTKIERDPETGLPFRQFYAEPILRKTGIRVKPGETTTHDTAFKAKVFDP
jgi:hypothetical protein